MPLYTFQCPEGHKFDKIVKLKNFDVPQECPTHGWIVERVVVAPMVMGDYAGYSCPVTGKWIEGRKAHTENLKRTESRLYEPGEREERVEARAKEDASFEAKVERTIEEEIDKLPTRVKEKLGEELAAGVDIKVERL